MNIDFLPSVKSSAGKVTSAADAEGIAAKDGTESSGESFFSKLSALFKGDDKGEVKASDSQLKSVSKGEPADESTDAALSVDQSDEGEAVDEILAAEEGGESAESADEQGSQTNSKVIATAATATTTAALVKASQSHDAEKVMGEGDQILNKLKQANQALAQSNPANRVKSTDLTDGKELPSQTDADLTASEASGVKVASNPAVKEQSEASQLVGNSEPIKSAESAATQPLTQNDNPAAAKHSQSVMLENSDLTESQKSQLAAATLTAAIAGGKIGENEQVVADEMAAAVAQAQLETEASSGSLAELETLSEQEQLALAAAASITFQQVSGQTATAESRDEVTGENTESLSMSEELKSSEMLVPQTNGTDIPLQKVPADQLNFQAAAPAAALAASLTASSDEVQEQTVVAGQLTAGQLIDADSADQSLLQSAAELDSGKQPAGESKLARQIHHSMQSALQPAPATMNITDRMAAQNALATPANPVDLASNSTAAANAVMPTMAATAGAASLINGFNSSSKASWSAAHLEAAGRAAQEADEGHSAKDSAFAQQLSSLSGISSQHNQLNRTEQAQAQMPVMVTKDVAADQLSERVQMMLSKNLKNIDIRLDPPELGRMHIRMNMNGDAATVHFTVANQHVRDALEGSMPRLREMLAQQGVQLGETAVQQQGANQQQGYASGGRAQSQSGSNVGNEMGLNGENFDSDVKLDLKVGAKRDGISYYA